MQKDLITLARTNRLAALAALAERKSRANAVSNVHEFPVSRTRQPIPVFTSIRGKRMNDLLAA